ncbi:MAG: M14 family metallopeptidase [Actinomycetota bacterium]
MIELAPDYRTARRQFLDAAESAGVLVDTTVHPLTGLHGEELAVDVAGIGPTDAEHVVVVVSGTHGVEGYCGSALQTDLLRHLADRPLSTARLVCVHALNPYGFSWVRRVNEDNVDLNRNFVDWSAPIPVNGAYDEIAELLVPTSWSSEVQQQTTEALMARALEVGLERFQEIVSSGQYSQPTGIFHGGSGPTWSHRWLRSWAAGALGSAKRLEIIDLHTGLGPWGHGELIGSEPVDDPAHVRASSIWGDVRSMVDGDSVSAELSGDWTGRAQELAPSAVTTAVALEFGTVDTITVLQSLRADAWLHAHGDPTGPEGEVVRSQVRAAFADDDPRWISTCRDRFIEVLDTALIAAVPA